MAKDKKADKKDVKEKPYDCYFCNGLGKIKGKKCNFCNGTGKEIPKKVSKESVEEASVKKVGSNPLEEQLLKNVKK